MEKFSEKTIKLKNKEILLRQADGEDAQAAIDFLNIISEETPFTYNYPGQQLKPENLTNRFAADKKSSNNLRLFALEKNKIIAQISCWKINPEHPWLKHKAEFAMMVVKDWWGTGIAQALLKEVDAFAASTGITRIEATVNSINERGVALYQKNGYVIEGTAKNYKIVDGKPLDSYFIAKLL